MPGRKGKELASSQPSEPEGNANAQGGKFRRKISHGLSFISNPLSQRKLTASRHPPGQSKTAVDLSALVDPNASNIENPPRQGPSIRKSEYQSPAMQALSQQLALHADQDATPRPVQRSRTMSHIPKPSGGRSSIGLALTAPKPRSPSFVLNPQAHASATSIPVPSPVERNNRTSISPPRVQKQRSPSFSTNPRASVTPTNIPTPVVAPTPGKETATTKDHNTHREKYIGAGRAFAHMRDTSPSKGSLKSHTTPNLLRSGGYPSNREFMTPRRQAPQPKLLETATPQRVSNKENLPHGNSELQRTRGMTRHPNAQTTHRQSQARVSRIYTQPSLHGKQSVVIQGRNATPAPKESQSSTSLSATTPLTAKRIQPNQLMGQLPSHGPLRASESLELSHTRLTGPGNPPTPDTTELTALPAIPKDRVDKDVSDEPISTPSSNRIGPIFSRPAVTTKVPNRDEVRENIRSTTIPHLSAAVGSWQPPKPNAPTRIPYSFTAPNMIISAKVCPPVPKIPEKWIIPSRPFLIQLGFEAGSVTDYMPPVWWAARFLARMDQWRTEAMRVHIDQKYKAEGELAHLSLEQQDLAACYIFLQLRRLCASDQAANSLWEYEFKYRRDNGLLDLLMSKPRPPQETPKKQTATEDSPPPKEGPISRAVRKLTPKKSSFVNLLKGKGWGKGDDGHLASTKE